MSVVDAFDTIAAGTKEIVDAVVIAFAGSQALARMGDRVAHAIASTVLIRRTVFIIVQAFSGVTNPVVITVFIPQTDWRFDADS